MSWARVDDGMWEHPKFEALREGGHRDAIALWVLALSYCGRKGNARITVREASMLLCCGEADAESACELLRSSGLLDVDSASKQTRSYVVHDWEQYRSKDEAKAAAGRKGGEKSGESRRRRSEAESKQSRSSDEADAKQTRTPVPVPVPDPVTRSRTPTVDEAGDQGSQFSKLSDFEQILSDHRLSVVIGSNASEWFSALKPTLRELRWGAEKASSRKTRPDDPVTYILGAIENDRKRADEHRGRETPPPKPPPPKRPQSIDITDKPELWAGNGGAT